MKKRIFAALCTAAMLGTLFTGCGNSQAVNGVVNVYNWGGYIETDLLDEFTEQTGIKVNYSTYESNEAMYTKLRSGSVNYDVIIPSDYMISRLINEDMLMKLDFEQIPNYANIDEQYRNLIYDPTNEYSIPYTWGTTGIIYNPNMVKAPITKWADLFDESLLDKHSVLMFDNSRDCIAIALMALGYDINTSSTDEINEAVDLLVKQKESGLVQAYVWIRFLIRWPTMRLLPACTMPATTSLCWRITPIWCGCSRKKAPTCLWTPCACPPPAKTMTTPWHSSISCVKTPAIIRILM